VNTLRHLGLFLLLGLALFGVKQALQAAPSKPVLVVHVPESASQQEVERAIDEAVLVDQGLSRGSVLLDPVVRDQLLRSMRVGGEGESTDERALMDHALSLGVHRADPLVRKRLAFQAEQVLRTRLHADPPTDKELERYLAEHEDRYRKPERVSFAHVFLSNSRHPEDMAETTRRVGGLLAQERPAPADAFRYSEPTILPLQVVRSTKAEIAARFGAAFAAGLDQAPEATWHGPLASSYGEHFVHVTAREPSELGSLRELRTRLLADRERDLKTARVAREVREMRARYRVEVRRERARPSEQGRAPDLMD
jgi:hypothetical protein